MSIKSILGGLVLMTNLSLFNFAQEIDSKNRITLDRIYNGDFSQENFGPLKWLAGGEFYTVIERDEQGATDLLLFDSQTGEKSILIDGPLMYGESEIPIENYSWSKDEKSLLIFTNSKRVWRTNTRGDYYYYDLQTKELRQLGKGLSEASLMFAKFSPGSDAVAYVSGNNIYVESLDEAERRQLTRDGNEDIINGTFDWAYEEEFFCKDGFRWSPDGSAIAYWQVDASEIKDFTMINYTNDIYPELIKFQYPKVGENPSSAKIGIVGIESGDTEWIDIPGDQVQNYIPRIQWLTPQKKLLITQLSRKQNHLKLWVYDDEQKELTKVYEEKSDSWIDIENIDISSTWDMHDRPVLNEGKSVVWVSEKAGWRHLYRIDVDDNVVTPLTSGNYDIASIKGVNENEDFIYVIASPENPTQRFLYAIDIKGNQEPKRLTPGNLGGVNSYTISPSGKYALFRHEEANKAPSGEIITLPDHHTRQNLYDNKKLKAALESLQLPDCEFFKITTDDGIDMDGKMLKPTDFDPEKRYPVLFFVYGEPAGQTATDRLDRMWHLMLAQDGYLIITMDNRGTPSLKGTTWRKSIYRKIGVLNPHDQAMAAQKILEWDFVDPERIAVWGWSGGGSMTLNLMFKYPHLYKTGISIAAVSNQLFYDNIYQERYMGLPSENLKDFIQGSPATHVSGLEGNLLYIHGTGDDNVHYQNAEYLINALIRENKLFDLMIYPNRSHGIHEGENTSRHLFTKMTAYLKKHVPSGGISASKISH